MPRKTTRNPPADDWFRLIFNSVDDAIIIYEAETRRILDVNHRAMKLWDYSLAEMRRLNPSELGSGVAPHAVEDLQRLVLWGLSEGSHKFEWQAKTRTGNFFWIEGNIRLAHIVDRDILIITCRDITERKRLQSELNLHQHRLMSLVESPIDSANQASQVLRSEVLGRVQAVETLREVGMKYKTIIEQIDEGFMLVDGQGRVSEWNLAMEHLCGMPKGRVIGSYFWEVMSGLCVPECDPTGIRESLQNYLREGVRQTLINGRTAPLNASLPSVLFKPTGTRISCRMTAFPVGMDSGWQVAIVINQR